MSRPRSDRRPRRALAILAAFGIGVALAAGLVLALPMSERDAVGLARERFGAWFPGDDSTRFEVSANRAGWLGNWYVDFRDRNGPGGVIVVIDGPDGVFPGPDIYPIEYVDRNETGPVLAPGYEGLWEYTKARMR